MSELVFFCRLYTYCMSELVFFCRLYTYYCMSEPEFFCRLYTYYCMSELVCFCRLYSCYCMSEVAFFYRLYTYYCISELAFFCRQYSHFYTFYLLLSVSSTSSFTQSQGEIKRREVVLGPQVSPEESKSREVELGSESWTSFASVVTQQRCNGHCPCDSAPHSS